MAAYIKERTKNAQFIVISLRNNMFELAARLVGVYKVNHMVSYSFFFALSASGPVLISTCRRRASQWRTRI